MSLLDKLHDKALADNGTWRYVKLCFSGLVDYIAGTRSEAKEHWEAMANEVDISEDDMDISEGDNKDCEEYAIGIQSGFTLEQMGILGCFAYGHHIPAYILSADIGLRFVNVTRYKKSPEFSEPQIGLTGIIGTIRTLAEKYRTRSEDGA